MLTAAFAATAMMMSGQPPAPPAMQQSRVAPRGSYAQSCSGAYVNQGRLYADCRDTRGRTRGTSIELNRCSSSDIGNDNGLLVCHNVRGQYEDQGRPGGGGNNNRPGGGWGNNNGGGWGSGGGWNNSARGSITVYRDSEYRGSSATLNREMDNLADTGMNDEISSIRLRGGAWEVCSDAYFRGNCQIIQGDVRDLRSLGLNDRISSLRPARGGSGGGNRW